MVITQPPDRSVSWLEGMDSEWHVGDYQSAGLHTIMREFLQGSKSKFLITSIVYMCSSRGVRYDMNPNLLKQEEICRDVVGDWVEELRHSSNNNNNGKTFLFRTEGYSRDIWP